MSTKQTKKCSPEKRSQDCRAQRDEDSMKEKQDKENDDVMLEEQNNSDQSQKKDEHFVEDNKRNRDDDEHSDNNNEEEDDDDDDLSMYEDDDDDDDEVGLYGQKRSRPDFSTGAPPGSFEMYALNRKELEDRRVKQHEVIRQILADFDIEEVKDKYRGTGIVRDYSHANRKFRLWLEKVMGDDKIKLSDRKWQDLFRQKVMEDYEHKLQERERQLAEAEVQRIQRLRLQGILTSDDTRATTNGHRRRSGSKKKNHKTLTDHSNKHQFLYTRPQDDIETQMEIINKDAPSRSRTRTPSSPRDGLEENGEDNPRERQEEEDGILHKDAHEENDKSPPSNNGHLGMSGTMRPARNPHIKCLYREEDLQQLYARAEELLRPTNTTASN